MRKPKLALQSAGNSRTAENHLRKCKEKAKFTFESAWNGGKTKISLKSTKKEVKKAKFQSFKQQNSAKAKIHLKTARIG